MLNELPLLGVVAKPIPYNKILLLVELVQRSYDMRQEKKKMEVDSNSRVDLL